MQWTKKGPVYSTSGEWTWSRTHATLPTPYLVDNNTLRIYYSSRDSLNQSNISYIDTIPHQPENVFFKNPDPVLTKGSLGAFDDSGVMPSQVLAVGDEVWMYYFGWNVRNIIPYHNSIGLAVSKDNGVTFERFSEGPLVDRNYVEPFFCATPFVLKTNEEWQMWYLSCTKWMVHEAKAEPFYHIKQADSRNGVDWKRDGNVAIDYSGPDEAGIARPCVIMDDHGYHMWYSYRKLSGYRENRDSGYKIGYAVSEDGKAWTRKDESSGIELSKTGWDSQMIAYPYVYDIGEVRYMLYNGNGFGKSGFGYAVLE
ncbi:MAG: hypothetical protein ACE37D_12995 [Pseudomonadales bacterium]